MSKNPIFFTVLSGDTMSYKEDKTSSVNSCDKNALSRKRGWDFPTKGQAAPGLFVKIDRVTKVKVILLRVGWRCSFLLRVSERSCAVNNSCGHVERRAIIIIIRILKSDDDELFSRGGPCCAQEPSKNIIKSQERAPVNANRNLKPQTLTWSQRVCHFVTLTLTLTRTHP